MELAFFLLTILWPMKQFEEVNIMHNITSSSIDELPRAWNCICSVTVSRVSSIRCYECDPTVITRDGRYQRCDYVNASHTAYIRECPRSTMCSKRVTTFDTGTGIKIKSVVRGCASQTQDFVPALNQSKWYYPNIIYEPYEEKCAALDPSNGDKVTLTHVCYCRGDLCNGNNDYNTTLHSNNNSNVPDGTSRILSTGLTTMFLAIGIILISSC